MGLIVPTAVHSQQDSQPLPYDWFVGIDWGSQQHQVFVLDRDRRRGLGQTLGLDRENESLRANVR